MPVGSLCDDHNGSQRRQREIMKQTNTDWARRVFAFSLATGAGILALGHAGQAAPRAILKSGAIVKGKGLKARATNTPAAAAGYKVALFTAAPTGFTGPDSIAVDNGHVFVGYGDAGGKTGGGTSTVAEFNADGTLLQTFTFAGHNDGLKVDPTTHLLWAMQNEDGNPQVVILDPANPGGANVYPLTSMNSGGGYDDIVFRGGNVYFSASNPANSPNTGSAIVQATLTNGAFVLTPVLAGNATATNVLTGAAAPLNLQDPDSMTLTPAGDLLLDSQADDELVTVAAATGAVSVLPITVVSGNPAQTASDIDDTVFAKSASDTLLVADKATPTMSTLSRGWRRGRLTRPRMSTIWSGRWTSRPARSRPLSQASTAPTEWQSSMRLRRQPQATRFLCSRRLRPASLAQTPSP